MNFNPTHVWSYYVEGHGAAAEPVEVLHARDAYGPHGTPRTVVRTVDGVQRRAYPADVAPLSARAKGIEVTSS